MLTRMTRLRLYRRLGMAMAVMVLAIPPDAHAQRLLETDGIELLGEAQLVMSGGGTCNVLESDTAYEARRENDGAPMDIWRLDFSVRNGGGRWLDHLIGRFQIESKRDREIARGAMALTETEQLSDRTLDTLSGGERQRVFVSRALAQKPRVLLLDEPTSNLDILHQLKVLGLIRRLVDAGLTAIAAIHDLHMAARYCDRLVLLNGGRVAATGTPEQVLSVENIESAFGVRSAVYRDDRTGSLAISLIGPADERATDEEGLTAVAEVAGAVSGRPATRGDQLA